MPTWIEYWNGDHPIYVSERHKLLHARGIASDFRRHIPSRDAVVLDYGCGEALYAEDVASLCARLVLCDAAPDVRAKLARRVAGVANAEVVSPEELDAMDEGVFDLVVVNSVLQYLDEVTLASLLALWRARLKENGRLILADVIPPGLGSIGDASALLAFGLRGGFFKDALAGLARTALSDYRQLRGSLGITRHAEDDFLSLLSRHGFQAERVQPNFGHNQRRMTFVATPA